MIAELHCHTSEYSACSHVNAIELITRAFNLGMQAIVITDHHYQWNDKELAEVKEKAGLPDIFHVLAGQEYNTSDYGDILIYGAPHTIKERRLSLKEVRIRYPEAAIIWAHPYRKQHIPSQERLLNPLHDGIEIFSTNYSISEAARGLKDWHSLKFTAIAGTDTHALSYTGSYPTVFDHPFTRIEEMVNEIKAGRCRPLFKEIPRTGTTDTEVTEIVIGPKSSEKQKKIILKTYSNDESWEEGKRSHIIINEMIKQGFNDGKYRVSRPLDKDEKKHSLIEEQVDGEDLYELLCKSEPADAERYLKMAAEWLAYFHNMNIRVSPPDEYLKIEEGRLIYYLSGMYENNHPHTERAQQILDQVWKDEQELIASNPDILTQGHGDFHMKNIFIGKDKEDVISAIDFNSSYLLPRAFDVGTFLAQYKNMFFDRPEIYFKAPSEIFYREYLKQAKDLPQDFGAQVNLYIARTYLSIIYYLVKVGKGESENFWTIMVNAERSLNHYSLKKER